MIPNQVRDALAEYVTDSNNDPMNILGAAICMMRLHGDEEEQRIAAAVDYAVRVEIASIKMIGRVSGHA